MNTLRAGYSCVDITAPLGTYMDGYYVDRHAEGVLDPLLLRCMAFACGEDKVILIAMDACEISTANCDELRKQVSEKTGLPVDAIFAHTTHTHTAAELMGKDVAGAKEYARFVQGRAADAAVMALEDLKPAKMGYAIGQAPNIAFVRRFRMKDGSVQTNPGVDNPDIVHPIGDVDERVNVLRFDREGADTLVLMNFGNHPDVVGGSRQSADWPGLSCVALERAIPGVKAIFFNGAQGDVNHVNVHPRGGDLNDLENDLDDVTRGYGHALHMANVVAGGVLQVYSKVKYVDVDSIRFTQKILEVPSNMPTPEDDMAEAHRIRDIHAAGRDDELPWVGMMRTTVVAKACRLVRLEKGPAIFQMPLTGLAIGPVAMVGLPGEPFNGIGRAIKEAPDWALVLPTCNTNAKEGYFPMLECYEEGGYEAGSSSFKAGVAELIIDEGRKMLSQLKEA